MAGEGGGLFSKTGKDSLNIAGHKVPIALIGGVAALLTVLLVLRARSRGQGVSAGAVPGANTGVNPVIDYGAGVSAPDYGAALANLNQQLTGVSQQLAGMGTTTPAPTPTPSLPAPTDFALSFGSGAVPTVLQERGNVITATNVSPQLGGEWASIAFGGENPTDVYGFIQHLYSSYGIGTPPPSSGTFRAYGPGGTAAGLQNIPFWAPGAAPHA